jgi:hypothetical protein
MNTQRAFHVLPFLLTCLSLTLLCGCPPGPRGWSRIYGGTESDFGHDVRQTSDGGYIVAGRTYSFGAGSGDMYLLKLAANGDLMWSNTYGGLFEDTARRVVQASDGGYVMAGSTESFGAGASDACLVKMDSGGTLLWSQTYGTTDSETAWGLTQTSDGGYILVGRVYSSQTKDTDILLVKTDKDGTEEWSRALDYDKYDEGFGVVQTTDGGYAIAGVTLLLAEVRAEMLLVKTDADGVPQWSRKFGETAAGYDIRQTSDGGYVMAGVSGMWSLDPWEEQDGFMVKTDAAGTEEWSHVHDSPGEMYFLRSVRQTGDGGFIFAGDIGEAALLMKTAPNGVEQWSRTYGSSGDTTRSIASAVIEPSLGGFCFAGAQYHRSSTDWSVYLVRTDALGSVSAPLPVP